jgi:hypothetical protein
MILYFFPVGFLGALTQIPNYIPTNGLVGWWPFNGNANDESDNGNNGSVNGASLTIDRFGNANKAYSFNGINDYISVDSSASLDIPNDLTISFWYYSLSNNFQHLIDRDICFESNDWAIYWSNSQVTSRTGVTGSDLTCNTSTLQLNIWYHIIIKRNGNKLINYINGIPVDSTIINNNSFANSDLPIYFGESVCNSSSQPNTLGNLDDIGIWDRALTQEEISNLYNAPNCSYNLLITPTTNQLETGSTANFIASTSDPNPSYVWQSDLGQGFQTLINYGNYSGTNTNSLSISNVQLANHAQPIRVISTSGECIDTSNVATINITDTCIVTINDTITTLISVTDTLVINTLVTGLTPPNILNTIKIFPNPTNSHITIDFGIFESMNGYTLTITNSIGQIVFTTPVNQQSSYVDLSTWSGNGIYFVQIIDTQNNTIENRKIVLQ